MFNLTVQRRWQRIHTKSEDLHGGPGGRAVFEHMAWPEVTAVESEFRFSGGNGRVGNGHLSAHSEFFPSANPTHL